MEKGTDMGWPYAHYDSALGIRLEAPEYGGDGKAPVTVCEIRGAGGGFFPLMSRPWMWFSTVASSFPWNSAAAPSSLFMALAAGDSGRP